MLDTQKIYTTVINLDVKKVMNVHKINVQIWMKINTKYYTTFTGPLLINIIVLMCIKGWFKTGE